MASGIATTISNEANNWDTVSKNVNDIDMSGFVQGK